MSEQSKKVEKRSPEVSEKATRRRFKREYKERILSEADRCTVPGELGALQRREGLYSSILQRRRKQRTQETLGSDRRGRKPKPKSQEAQELTRLKRQNERLAEKLRQAELNIEVQNKFPR